MAWRNSRRRLRTVIVLVLACLLGAGAYVAVRQVTPALEGSGCQAVAGGQSVPLDTQQAGIAATIAGVAHSRAMPARAVTIAYAAALQESKMHNLSYGDRDSVGVFQQRPSEGWGTASELMDPVYATAKFFGALAKVPGYQSLPVYQAAQQVQRSADGAAYSQYAPVAARLTQAFTGRKPHAVWCWSPAAPSGPARLAAAGRALAADFGPMAAIRRSPSAGSGPTLAVRATGGPLGWSVAAWLVTHARAYRLHDVRYQGLRWQASAGADGWTRGAGPGPTGSVLAS